MEHLFQNILAQRCARQDHYITEFAAVQGKKFFPAEILLFRRNSSTIDTVNFGSEGTADGENRI